MADRLSWVGSPNTRGTMDILWSCLTTLGLCVWTAVHPNILLHPGRFSNLAIRILLMLTAVIFPEIIISAALRQRSLASRRRLASTTKVPPTAVEDSPIATTTAVSHVEDKDVESSLVTRRHFTRSDQDQQGMISQENIASVSHTSGAAAAASVETNSSSISPSDEKTSPVEVTQSVGNDDLLNAVEGNDASAGVTRVFEHHKWTRQQIYFVVMGGFTVELPDATSTLVPYRRYFLTVDALPFLELGDCLPVLSVDDVSERSNADVITKIIVIVQTVWFATQIIARLVSQISVTALEVHTIVHVACAIVMYGLWWDKPYNVGRSIEVNDQNVRAIAALFVQKQRLERIYRQDVAHYETAMQRFWREGGSGEQPSYPARQSISILLGDTIHVARKLDKIDRASRFPGLKILSLAQDGLKLLLEKDSAVIARLDKVFDGVRESTENFTALSVWGSWTRDQGHEWNFDKSMHVLFNVLYGAGHLAAWSSTAFPTNIERWLWRASSLMLVSVLGWAALWILYWKASRSRLAVLRPVHSGELNSIIGPLYCLVMLGYVLARCYFLIEALISLRSLPASAFQLVRWTYFLPHAS